MRLDDKIVNKNMVCHHSKFNFLILFGLAEAKVCFEQIFKCFIMAALIKHLNIIQSQRYVCSAFWVVLGSASMRLPQLLHFAIPAIFSNLKCNQTFEGYFGSAETSTNNRFSNFLLVEYQKNISTNVSDVSSFTFRNNFRTKHPLCHKLRTTPFLIA